MDILQTISQSLTKEELINLISQILQTKNIQKNKKHFQLIFTNFLLIFRDLIAKSQKQLKILENQQNNNFDELNLLKIKLQENTNLQNNLNLKIHEEKLKIKLFENEIKTEEIEEIEELKNDEIKEIEQNQTIQNQIESKRKLTNYNFITNSPKRIKSNESIQQETPQKELPNEKTNNQNELLLLKLRSTLITKKNIHDPSKDSSITPICVPFQKGHCYIDNCKRGHLCINCNDSHPLSMCQRNRNICVKYNLDSCDILCNREHRCLRCNSKEHTLAACDIQSFPGVAYCYLFNGFLN